LLWLRRPYLAGAEAAATKKKEWRLLFFLDKRSDNNRKKFKHLFIHFLK
jgi:hypothetical protein